LDGQLHIPVALTPKEKTPGTHSIVGRVGPITGLNDMERRKILPLQVLELGTFNLPALGSVPVTVFLRYI
jgi:hypothetical protein